MKVKGLDGKEKTLSLGKYRGKSGKSSKLHESCRSLIKEVFPMVEILEEVRIPGSLLKLDFFLPSISLIVEADGRQHDKYTSFFHQDKREFYLSKKRDSDKELWAEINEFTVIRLSATESEDERKRKLEAFFRDTGRI